MKLPEFPPDRGKRSTGVSPTRQNIHDAQQKQIAIAARVALADLIYAMSEPNPEQE